MAEIGVIVIVLNCKIGAREIRPRSCLTSFEFKCEMAENFPLAL
jgi:hypothetical protein